jgi:hypothetical protein
MESRDTLEFLHFGQYCTLTTVNASFFDVLSRSVHSTRAGLSSWPKSNYPPRVRDMGRSHLQMPVTDSIRNSKYTPFPDPVEAAIPPNSSEPPTLPNWPTSGSSQSWSPLFAGDRIGNKSRSGHPARLFPRSRNPQTRRLTGRHGTGWIHRYTPLDPTPGDNHGR